MGLLFKHPNLTFLSKFWQDGNIFIQQASRSLISFTLSNYSLHAKDAIVEFWKPFLSSGSDKKSARASAVLGIIGSYDPNCLSPNVRKLVAESLLTLLVEDKRALVRIAAMELIGLGYSIWQPCTIYFTADINANLVVKLLFGWHGKTPDKISQAAISVARESLLDILCVSPTDVLTVMMEFLSSKTMSDRISGLKFLSIGIQKVLLK
jgi:hypothetical protein